MMDSTTPFVLAIDGGGTRCRFALDNGNVRHVVQGGSANVSSDFDASVACILNGLQLLSEDSGLPLDRLMPLSAFVGLAGVTGPEIAARLKDVLPLSNADYADDRRSALRGALGPQDGVVVHCGTGSFFAAQIAGDTRLTGGWGSVLGDEASAQWVGRRALAMTLDQVDGYVPATDLTDAILARFDGAPGIVAFASTATPADFGSLAPMVTSLALENDAIAQRIMTNAANYIEQNLHLLGYRPGMTLCLTGGIGRYFAPYLSEPVQQCVSEPAASPLDGALDLARDRLKEADNGHH